MDKKLQKFLLLITISFTTFIIFFNPFTNRSVSDVILQKVFLKPYFEKTSVKENNNDNLKSNPKRHPSIISHENRVNSRSIISSNFDFNAQATTEGKFKLSFYNPYQKDITIKVYDIIGNLVLEEKINMQGSFQKEYNVSDYKTKLFIIEVDNGNYSLTKRINTI